MQNIRLVCAVCGLIVVGESYADKTIEVRPGMDVQRVLDAASDGATVLFASGDYPIGTALFVSNKTDFVLRGEPGARFVIRFSPEEAKKRAAQGFLCDNCRGLIFERMAFTTDRPVNCNGTVIAVNPERDSYDVRVDEGFPLDARQVLAATDTVTPEGTPDCVIQSYDDTPYEIIGEQTIRVKGPRRSWPPKWRFDYSKLKVGQRIVYRYMKSGRHVFRLSNCEDMVFRDVTLERYASFGVRICARSRNATFERFNVLAPSSAHELMPGNVDGIHVQGMSGKLVLKDCHFRGLGDDALNVHSLAGFVKSYDVQTGVIDIRRRDRHAGEILHDEAWAWTGDEILVYDPKTFLEKGRFVLCGHRHGRGSVTQLVGDLAVGDVLANATFNPQVIISGCAFENSSSRGVLLQSQNMLIENCRFSGHIHAGLLIAPDIKMWNEVGPAKNVVIRNCEFVRCGLGPMAASLGAIVIKASHEGGEEEYPVGVHREIVIVGNDFHDNGTRGIYVSAVKGLSVRDNRFARNAPAPDGRAEFSDVRIVKCEEQGGDGRRHPTNRNKAGTCFVSCGTAFASVRVLKVDTPWVLPNHEGGFGTMSNERITSSTLKG